MYIYQNLFTHISERFARISFGKSTTGEGKGVERWKFYCINIHPKVTFLPSRTSDIFDSRVVNPNDVNERARYLTRKWIETQHTTARHLFYLSDARAAYYNWLCAAQLPSSHRNDSATEIAIY